MFPGDHFLLGTDLIKDRVRRGAYDDSEGVTAEFNKNVLEVLNRELGADFDLDAFEHVARYDAAAERMDIRLRSRQARRCESRNIDLTIEFAAGEELKTEISTKFNRERLDEVYASRRARALRLVHRSGWGLRAQSRLRPIAPSSARHARPRVR